MPLHRSRVCLLALAYDVASREAVRQRDEAARAGARVFGDAGWRPRRCGTVRHSKVTGALLSTATASSRRRRSRKSNTVNRVSRLIENNSNTVVLPIGAATRIAIMVDLARLTIHLMRASPAHFSPGTGTIAKMPSRDPG